MLEYITFTDCDWLTNRSWPSVTRCLTNKTVGICVLRAIHYLAKRAGQ